MYTYFLDIIPKLLKFSLKLDNLTKLTDQYWVLVDENISSKIVYIFRDNNELLVSKNGQVERAKWDYLGNDALLIESKDNVTLYRNAFLDEVILVLKADGCEDYACFVNEKKYGRVIQNIQELIKLLKIKYLNYNKSSVTNCKIKKESSY
ncbi:hypothetical protein [Saccharicrinis fermentans]|uniref:hypothetical protein n=1 Tax=Saccharicrinis fermentans TaxID=982 RepID=UPI00048054A5|nr:hypothetical protein [Saccharicrinis fermentans]